MTLKAPIFTINLNLNEESELLGLLRYQGNRERKLRKIKNFLSPSRALFSLKMKVKGYLELVRSDYKLGAYLTNKSDWGFLDAIRVTTAINERDIEELQVISKELKLTWFERMLFGIDMRNHLAFDIALLEYKKQA